MIIPQDQPNTPRVIYRFAEDKRVLWAAPSDGIASELKLAAHHAKLHGKHNWSFELSLPSTVTLPLEKGGTKTYHLPSSFGAQNTHVTIYYSLLAVVHHALLERRDV